MVVDDGDRNGQPQLLFDHYPQLPQAELVLPEPAPPENRTHLPLPCSFTGPA